MKINELEDLLGVTRATIRYYEKQGLVTPPRTENGYRDYGDEEARLFQKIIVLRKLGVGVPEIRDLIEAKAELHDVLVQNADRLREQQDEIAAAIEMCGELDAEAADFESIDSSKYLKSIYESEQKGTHFAETKEISFRQLNLAIALIGAMAGIAIPQNNIWSEHSNDPIPTDIRANKKEGEAYDTIGDALKRGGTQKVIIVIALVVFCGFIVVSGLARWGLFGSGIRFGLDYEKSGIITDLLSDDEMKTIAEADPEVADADLDYEMFRFHTQDGLVLTLKRSENGSWTDVYTKETGVNEGILFVTGEPSSEIVFHIVADGNSRKYGVRIDDSAYNKEDDEYPYIVDGENSLNKERIIMIFYKANDSAKVNGLSETTLNSDAIAEELPDGCYAVTVQDAIESRL